MSTITENQESLVLEILKKDRKNISNQDLALIANQVRHYIIEMVYQATCGHPGGALGMADIYTSVYFKYLNYDVKNPTDEKRDRLLLSNGHICAVRYACMALAGYFPIEELNTFRKLGTRLQGHPSTRYLPEVENSSGSLGQGLSNGCGLALGLRYQKSDARVFVGMSDGECQEGLTWEAAMAASHYKLNNIIPFIDYNNIQIDGFVDKVMNVGDLKSKFESFGWQARVADGHDFSEINESFDWALEPGNAPKIIVFKTLLGKGVSFMENVPGWHGVAPKEAERDQAHKELNEQAKALMG